MALTIQERLKDLRVGAWADGGRKTMADPDCTKIRVDEKLCAATGKTEIASDNREIAR